MREKWNKEQLQRRYNRVTKNALDRGFTAEELKKPYLDELSRQTKSSRILHMIKLAYYLGQLRAIQDIDESFTPVVLD